MITCAGYDLPLQWMVLHEIMVKQCANTTQHALVAGVMSLGGSTSNNLPSAAIIFTKMAYLNKKAPSKLLY
jgi:hypothetical protein